MECYGGVSTELPARVSRATMVFRALRRLFCDSSLSILAKSIACVSGCSNGSYSICSGYVAYYGY